MQMQMQMEECQGKGMRIRLVFKDESMLSKKQTRQGLKRCWLYVQPQLHTVGDIALYISCTFRLRRRCPQGVLLSMDGFTLPCSQPTCILKDKDIVSVNRQKDATEKRIVAEETTDSLKNSDSVGGGAHLLGGVKLLAMDEFEKEAGGYQSEHEDYGTNSKDADGRQNQKESASKDCLKKKRKRSDSAPMLMDKTQDANGYRMFLKSQIEMKDSEVQPKRKKKKTNSSLNGTNKKSWNASTFVEKEQMMDSASCQNLSDLKARKKPKCKKLKLSNSNKETDFQNNCYALNDHEVKESSERKCDEDEQMDPVIDVCASSQQRKVPSRSARRKKAKRLWLRQQNAKRQEENQKELNGKQSSVKCNKFHTATGLNEYSIEDKTCSVIVRPGHIRFVSSENEQEVEENTRNHMPEIQWKGVINKRQGQKWGKQGTYDKTVKGFHVPSEKEMENTDIEYNNTEDDRRENNNIGANINGGKTSDICSVVFDELPALAGLPQPGDVIAYRIVELSTSWCPELSEYRVGKVETFNEQSLIIRLIPVEEYPLNFKIFVDGERTDILECSVYKSDGSLEIEFTLLMDVRLVCSWNTIRESKSAGHATNTSEGSESHVPENDLAVQEPVTATYQNGDVKLDTDNKTASGDNDAEMVERWKQIEDIINAKKAELAALDVTNGMVQNYKERQRTKKDGSKQPKENANASRKTVNIVNQVNDSSSTRHIKLLRRSALGPVVSQLREQNIF